MVLIYLLICWDNIYIKNLKLKLNRTILAVKPYTLIHNKR